MNISGFGKTLACEPFVSRAPETKAYGTGEKKFVAHTAKTTLVPLRVVYGLPAHDIWPTDLVYVKQEGVASQWSKEIDVETPEGIVKVVLVPVDQVILVEHVSTSCAPSPMAAP